MAALHGASVVESTARFELSPHTQPYDGLLDLVVYVSIGLLDGRRFTGQGTDGKLTRSGERDAAKRRWP